MSDHPSVGVRDKWVLGDVRSLQGEAGHRRGAWCRNDVRSRGQIISSSRTSEALLCTLLWQKSSYIQQWELLSSSIFDITQAVSSLQASAKVFSGSVPG